MMFLFSFKFLVFAFTLPVSFFTLYIVKQKKITEGGVQYKVNCKIKMAEVLMGVGIFISAFMTAFGINNVALSSTIRGCSLLLISWALHIYSKEIIRIILSEENVNIDSIERERRQRYAESKARSSKIQVWIVAVWGCIDLGVLCYSLLQ